MKISIYALIWWCAAQTAFALEPTGKPEPAATKTEPTTILFIGDSLTEGYRLEKEEAFPHLVGEALRAQGKNVSVINAGVSGATSASGMGRLQWHLRAKPKPKILVLSLGANDGLRGQKVESTKENLSKTIKFAKTQGMQVLLSGMKMPPNYGIEYTSAFENMYRVLAKEENVALIPFLLEGVAVEKKLNLEDGIHPNAQGYKIRAKTVTKHLSPMLGP